MAPKRGAEILGDHTPNSEMGDKKKDDTTPSPVVDKDITPSEDDKKKKDSSSSLAKKGSTSRSGTQHTELTELSPSREGPGLAGKRKDMVGGRRGNKLTTGVKKRIQKEKSALTTQLKKLRKKQQQQAKHPRSFCGNIMRILRSVNETQPAEGFPDKRVNQLSMMIFDSFANDLCDKIIATAVELVKNTNKKQLSSNEIKAAMKLVLPADMASCAQEAVDASLMSYKDSTKKCQGSIEKAKKNKQLAAGNKKD